MSIPKRSPRLSLFRFRHIRTKLLVSYVMILILPFLLLGYIATNVVGSMYVEQKKKDYLDNIQILGENIRYTFSSIDDVLSDFCSNQDIWSYFYHQYQYPDSSIDGYYNTVKPRIANYKALHPEILTCSMYCTNQTVLCNQSEIRYLEPGSGRDIMYRQMLGSTRETVYRWLDGKLFANRISQLYGKPIGLFQVRIDADRLTALLGQEEDAALSLVQSDGLILLSSHNEYVGLNIGDTPMAQANGNDRGTVIRNGNGRLMIFSVPVDLPNGERSWCLVQTVSADIFYGVVRTNTRLLSLAILIMIILTVLMAILLSRSLTGRLKKIDSGIAAVEQGDFTVHVPVEGEDEVSALTEMLNKMIRRLDDLISENAEMRLHQEKMEILNREARLDALQSQINPHFIFNSLEAIQYGIHDKLPDTEKIVVLLAKNLRRLASWNSDTVSIREELDHTAEYLEIQHFRYGDRLKYEFAIDSSMWEYRIPALILQPLVENAVSHGIAMKNEGGTVRVTGEDHPDHFVISITDDGAGMDELAQEELKQTLSKPAGQSGRRIGFKNVYDRISLYYGDACDFEWSSTAGIGTQIRITVRKGVGNESTDRG